MALDTSNILKEMSALSSNMDSLVRELKEQTKNTAENTKSINDLVGEIKGEIKQKPTNIPDQKTDQTKLFQNLISSFSKEISRSNEMLQKTLGKELGSSLGDLTKNILKPAEIKPNLPKNLDFMKILGLDKLPKLEEGGEIKKDGIAVVGEAGPEIVNLKKDQQVISKEMTMQEIKKNEKTNPKEAQIQEVISGQDFAKLSTKKTIKNWQGIEIPVAEIESHMKEYKAKNPDFDEDELNDEREDFIEYYKKKKGPAEIEAEKVEFRQQIENIREKYGEEEAKKYEEKGGLYIPSAPKKTDVSSEKIETKPSLTEGKKKKKDPAEIEPEKESKKDKIKKENQKSIISPSKPKLLESLKERGKDIGSKLKKDFTSKSNEFKQGFKQTLSGQVSPSELENAGSMAQKMQKLAEDMKAAQVKKETPTLKKPEEPKNPSKPSPTPAPPSQDQPVSMRSSETPSIPSKTQEVGKIEKVGKESEKKIETLPPEEIKEIKALLAGIYKVLSGPLRISNDVPYRPNSNVI